MAGLLVLSSVLASGDVRAQDVRRARLMVKVPSRGDLQAVRVSVAGTTKSVVQDQASESADTLVNVGLARATEVDLRPEKGGIARRGLSDSRAIFYLHAQAEAVLAFEILPSFVMIDGVMTSSGRTPPVFVVEFLHLDRIGDVSGAVLQRFDRVSFELEKPNRFDVQLVVDPAKNLGVRVSVDPAAAAGHETLLQVKASKTGPYPMYWKSDTVSEPQVRSQAWVRFTYVPGATGGSLVGEDPAAQLAEEIRRHLAGQRPGAEVEIPLEIELKFR